MELLREMMNQNMFEEMTFQDILELENESDLSKPITETLKPNQRWIGMKSLATGELVPDIITIDDETDEKFLTKGFLELKIVGNDHQNVR